MSDFTLLIERLGTEPAAHTFEASAGWWAERTPEGQPQGDEVETPFVIRLEARRVGANVLVEGELEGRMAFECGRCTKRYSHPLREAFRLVLEPAKGDEPTDPEGERGLAERGLCLGEDLEAGWFRGPVVRLDDYFGELIALAMPIQPLCRDDCPGICPHCGVDLAESRCDCVDERIESPFAVLARLKREDGEERGGSA